MTPKINPNIPRGLCQCGCGQKTQIAVKDRPARLVKKGEPFRFIYRHHYRLMQRSEEERRKTSESLIRHGYARRGKASRTHRIWVAMKQRCFNPKNTAYKWYGARGITVCDRWANSFEAFLQDMGECPPKMTIDRKDNNGPYELANCRWTTHKQQMNNMRRNLLIEWNDNIYTLTQLAETYSINPATFYNRFVRLNWPIEEVIFKRVGYRNAIKQ